MTDPLIKKFKHFTFKLYDKELRDDITYFDKRFEEFAKEPTITIIDSWYDWDGHIKIHKNGVFRSTSYKTIQKKYCDKETKIEGVYLDFHDLDNMRSYNAWIIYCINRYNTNWKTYLPIESSKDEPKIIF